MAGYGNSDDHIEATANHIADSLALARLQAAPCDNTSGACLSCGDAIEPKRLLALPNCRRCCSCQEEWESAQRGKAKHICRNTYVP